MWQSKIGLTEGKIQLTSFQITILKKPQTQEIRDKAITLLRGNNLCNDDKNIIIKIIIKNVGYVFTCSINYDN